LGIINQEFIGLLFLPNDFFDTIKQGKLIP